MLMNEPITIIIAAEVVKTQSKSLAPIRILILPALMFNFPILMLADLFYDYTVNG